MARNGLIVLNILVYFNYKVKVNSNLYEKIKDQGLGKINLMDLSREKQGPKYICMFYEFKISGFAKRMTRRQRSD